MSTHGLNKEQLKAIMTLLKPYSQSIEQVGLFGSRATGHYRENSDIDMVLYGNLNNAMVDRIWTLFDESNLPMTVDVNAYDLITYPPLKAHIDSTMTPLFTKDTFEKEDVA